MKNSNFHLWGGAHSTSDGAGASFAAASDVRNWQASENAIVAFDIEVNIAHAHVLENYGLFSSDDTKKVVAFLNDLKAKHEAGEFEFDDQFEDIHSQIEHLMTEELGELGQKIHTARSRNDQVTTDMYLYLRSATKEVAATVQKFASALNSQADKYNDVVCPGYTHYQKGTVTSWGYVLGAYAKMFERDVKRAEQLLELFDYSPLGAGNGYMSVLDIDPKVGADKLGFAKPFENSVDVISSRGEYEASLAQVLSQIMTHASMLAQTLTIFSTQHFGMVAIGDSYTTGSSIMPQKKNPDVYEVIKSIAAEVNAQATAIMETRRGGFLGYNRDSQRTKLMITNAVSNTLETISVMTEAQATVKPNEEAMLEACSADFVTATGTMEIMAVELGVPLRSAKKAMEQAIRLSSEAGLNNVGLEQLNQALADSQIDHKISKEQLDQWSNPRNQFERIFMRP